MQRRLSAADVRRGLATVAPTGRLDHGGSVARPRHSSTARSLAFRTESRDDTPSRRLPGLASPAARIAGPRDRVLPSVARRCSGHQGRPIQRAFPHRHRSAAGVYAADGVQARALGPRSQSRPGGARGAVRCAAAAHRLAQVALPAPSNPVDPPNLDDEPVGDQTPRAARGTSADGVPEGGMSRHLVDRSSAASRVCMVLRPQAPHPGREHRPRHRRACDEGHGPLDLPGDPQSRPRENDQGVVPSCDGAAGRRGDDPRVAAGTAGPEDSRQFH